jgi:hypothetical protein
MAKGASFERDFSKKLSLWWTHDERDDVFWRSQASGGRATIRKRSNKTLDGQEGDICATDPIGKPLLDRYTIELKCGYGPWSCLDYMETTQKDSVFMRFVKQAKEQAKRDWMLVYKKDRHTPMICVDRMTYISWLSYFFEVEIPHASLYHMSIGNVTVFPLWYLFNTDSEAFRHFLKMDERFLKCQHH